MDNQMLVNNTSKLSEHEGFFFCSFCSNIQGIKAKQDHEKFDINRLFDAVASGDVTRLEGLEEYLCKTNKKLTNSECKNYVYNIKYLYTKSVYVLIVEEYSSNRIIMFHVPQIDPMGRRL